MSKFYNEKGEPRIVRPTGNYDEDFHTAVEMCTIGHSNYVRFLNDFRNVHNIIKIKSGDTNKNWVDYLELKKEVEEYVNGKKDNTEYGKDIRHEGIRQEVQGEEEAQEAGPPTTSKDIQPDANQGQS